MTDAETKPDALDHDGDGKKGGAKPTRPVWVVIRGEGLKRVAASEFAAAVADGRGRRATDRDLEIAGIARDER